MRTIKVYLKNHQQEAKKALDIFFDQELDSYKQIDPTLNSMGQEIRTLCLRGGKFTRSAITNISYHLSSSKALSDIFSATLAFELFHKFLLIHDDIIDRDLVRYAGPTLEAVYSKKFSLISDQSNLHVYPIGVAMISGDLLHGMSQKLITESNLKPKIKLKVLSVYPQILSEVIAGWKIQTDLNYQDINQVDEGNFLKGMELVSARYSFIWPLRLGQIMAGANKDQWRKELDLYGYHVGMAYQIQDDILGMFGDPNKTGKPVGNDYLQAKKSLLILRAFKLTDKKNQQFLLKTIGVNASPDDVKRASQIIIDTGSLKYSQNLAQDHIDKAKVELSKLKDSQYTQLLSSLADYVIKRDK
jgi:geranylgeranyl diphosphate synthase type I